MRKRYSLSFNLEDERHREAHALLKQQALKQQSEYIVNCILAAREKADLSGIVKQAVLDALGEGNVQPAAPKPEQDDIPQNMLAFLTELQSQDD